LQANPPATIGDVNVDTVLEFPEAGLLRLSLIDGTRLQVRPSGTEPKIKLYGEAVGADPEPGLTSLAGLLQEMAASLTL
jgi:phosphomannomutase